MIWWRLRPRRTPRKRSLLLSQSLDCTSFKIWYGLSLFTPSYWQAYSFFLISLTQMSLAGVWCTAPSFAQLLSRLCTVLAERRVQSPMSFISMKSYCILTCSFSSMFCLLFNLDFRNCRLCNLTPTAFCSALENLLPYGPNSISRRHTQHTSARAF